MTLPEAGIGKTAQTRLSRDALLQAAPSGFAWVISGSR